MLTKVTFFIFNNNSLDEYLIYTCRVIEKIYSKNHKIHIHTKNQEEAQNFDTRLWTFSDISFIPHKIHNSNSTLNIPIIIGYKNSAPQHRDTLINLSTEVFPSYQNFDKLIEIIPHDDQLKDLARKRFQTYKKEGFAIEVFKV
ncbi:MAG: DNA polymerase III subunit chi [Coxiellaceae bacterium]|jgi:DNA polymerase-3 subunit chi|nr:DNA polymerase III subunit chi [Coxiellaceae bacterium]